MILLTQITPMHLQEESLRLHHHPSSHPHPFLAASLHQPNPIDKLYLMQDSYFQQH